jgi:Lrp/AsnC family transcriptional regulator for asnA, asnC and gidA
MEPLDPQDQALVLALQAEPRARAVRLGEVLSFSATTVSTRLRHLIDHGAIEVIGILDYRALAHSYMAIALARGLPADVIASVGERRGVVFAAQTVGSWEGLVCFIDTDAQRMERHIDVLRGQCAVVEVHPVLDVRVTGLTRREPVPLRDALDDDIACLLAVDARMTFTAIARELDIPEATARLRAQRLLDGHVVTPLVIPNPALFGLNAAAALAVEVTGSVAPVLESLAAVPGVITTLHLQGRFAAAVEVIAPDVAAVAALRDQVLAIPGVREVEVLIYGQRVVGCWPLPKR